MRAIEPGRLKRLVLALGAPERAGERLAEWLVAHGVPHAAALGAVAAWEGMDADERVVGGLSWSSKMPGPCISLPPQLCNVGARLHCVSGSTCADCYALKNRYVLHGVRAALWRRAAMLPADNDASGWETWIGAMVRVIGRQARRTPWFRWHDAGDVQCAAHLAAICEVARRTPWCAHWLPTREVARVLAHGAPWPDNLTVRVSAPMVGGSAARVPGCVRSEVHAGAPRPGSTECLAYAREGRCGPCRLCWDRGIDVVSYRKH